MSEPIQSRNPIRLSLGPIQFFWQKETLLEFYVSMLDAPVDTIYLGEVVCSRRQKMRFADWYGLAENLADSGKEIILSSQVLLESETDLRRLRKITGQDRFKVEANDMGAVRLAREHDIPFVAGASLNIYNETTLGVFRELGAFRWVPPPNSATTSWPPSWRPPKASKPNCSAGAACRWPTRRAASPPATTTATRTPATSAAWTMKTAWC